MRHIGYLSSALLGLLTTSASAGLAVNSWIVGTGVYDHAPNGGYAEAFSNTVANPFTASYTPTLGDSHSYAIHHFSWSSDDANFHVTAHHQLASLDGETITSGRIVFAPSVDSLLYLDGTYGYAWPSATIGTSLLSFGVFDNDTEQTIITANRFGGNVGLGPPFGSLSIHESVMLPAGVNYLISYTARVHHFDPTPPGTFGNANADITFTLGPIPEPAVLAPLIFGALALRRRSRRAQIC
jgi:hypothetical protein